MYIKSEDIAPWQLLIHYENSPEPYWGENPYFGHLLSLPQFSVVWRVINAIGPRHAHPHFIASIQLKLLNLQQCG